MNVEHPAPPPLLTLGLVLGVTVVAVASLAVVTIAPLIPAELGGIERYGWIFSANLLATLVGTVWGGAHADRHGPGRAFAAGLAAFVGGSTLAALAPSIELLIAGRALQGLGGGAVVTAIYVTVSIAFPDRARARVLALLSSAWVVPALVGPAGAGLVAEATSWRWVFGALVPIAVAVAALTLPSFRTLGGPSAATERSVGRLALAALLAVGVGALLWSLGGDAGTAARWLIGPAAGVVALLAARRLLPPGTLVLRSGLGAVVAARGLLFAGFITVEVYLALMLAQIVGLSAALTGLVIATGAILWALGSWAQARSEGERVPAWAEAVRERRLRVRVGITVLGVGVLGQLAALALARVSEGSGAAFVVALAAWAVAALGIGFAHASGSLLAFEAAEREGVPAGRVSAALQLADGIAAATATGVAGALLARAAAQDALAAGVAAAYAVGLAVVLLSAWAASRIGAR